MTVLNGFLKVCCVTAICFSVTTASSFAEEADSAVVSKLVASAKGETTPSGVQSALCKQASVVRYVNKQVFGVGNLASDLGDVICVMG